MYTACLNVLVSLKHKTTFINKSLHKTSCKLQVAKISYKFSCNYTTSKAFWQRIRPPRFSSFASDPSSTSIINIEIFLAGHPSFAPHPVSFAAIISNVYTCRIPVNHTIKNHPTCRIRAGESSFARYRVHVAICCNTSTVKSSEKKKQNGG